ncbi:MAG: FHA domain-containing protein [Verrucomicrobia bacterium]|nr:FHA domain-containing protein [Verrucomicrobiota bacterium]
MPKLVSESKEFPGLMVELAGPRAGVGRADGNELQVLHGSVSSRHAELVLEGQEYKVRDLDSTNGTRVNDEKITEAQLQDRDRVQFGQIPFRYEGAVPRVALALPASGAAFQPEIGLELGIPANFRNISPIKGKGKALNPNIFLFLAAGVGLLGVFYYIYRMILD